MLSHFRSTSECADWTFCSSRRQRSKSNKNRLWRTLRGFLSVLSSTACSFKKMRVQKSLRKINENYFNLFLNLNTPNKKRILSFRYLLKIWIDNTIAAIASVYIATATISRTSINTVVTHSLLAGLIGLEWLFECLFLFCFVFFLPLSIRCCD